MIEVSLMMLLKLNLRGVTKMFSSLCVMGTDIIVTGFEDKTEEEVVDMDVKTDSSPTIATTSLAKTVRMTRVK